jgi:hypothetical protein
MRLRTANQKIGIIAATFGHQYVTTTLQLPSGCEFSVTIL